MVVEEEDCIGYKHQVQSRVSALATRTLYGLVCPRDQVFLRWLSRSRIMIDALLLFRESSTIVIQTRLWRQR